VSTIDDRDLDISEFVMPECIDVRESHEVSRGDHILVENDQLPLICPRLRVIAFATVVSRRILEKNILIMTILKYIDE
jgi:hypothetical protein